MHTKTAPAMCLPVRDCVLKRIIVLRSVFLHETDCKAAASSDTYAWRWVCF